jgi:hypothetical protein
VAECNFFGSLSCPLGHAVEESLIRSVTLKIGIARIPPRVKIHRQKNPTLRNMLVAEELEPELWEVRGPSYPDYLDATTVTFSAYCVS